MTRKTQSFIFYKITSSSQSITLLVMNKHTLHYQSSGIPDLVTEHLRWSVHCFNHRADLTNQASNKNSGSYTKTLIYERNYAKWCL